MRTERILDLHPTQLSAAKLQIDEKLKEIRRKKKSELRAFLKEHAVPVVVGPEGEKFLTDKHHFVSACWLAGLRKVPVKVLRRFSTSISYDRFWKEMRAHHWCHLEDQYGKGPHSPLYLPQDVRGLGDDPYRALSYLVREAGGYESSDAPFAEFRWADFFRERRLLEGQFSPDYEAVLPKALKLAGSKAARRLPGYKGKTASRSTRKPA